MASTSKKKVGRPRAKPRASDVPARTQILLSAAKLFYTHGYDGTTTRQIADAVGIRQPSLFYHFKKKDDILLAIIDEAGAIWLDRLGEFLGAEGNPSVRLYALMRFDYYQLLTEPFGIGQLLALPQLRSGVFYEAAQGKIDAYTDAYRKLLRQGVRRGELIVDNIEITTRLLIGLGESTWSWYGPEIRTAPKKIAEQMADLALRSVLRRPGDLAKIKKKFEAG